MLIPDRVCLHTKKVYSTSYLLVLLSSKFRLQLFLFVVIFFLLFIFIGYFLRFSTNSIFSLLKLISKSAFFNSPGTIVIQAYSDWLFLQLKCGTISLSSLGSGCNCLLSFWKSTLSLSLSLFIWIHNLNMPKNVPVEEEAVIRPAILSRTNNVSPGNKSDDLVLFFISLVSPRNLGTIFWGKGGPPVLEEPVWHCPSQSGSWLNGAYMPGCRPGFALSTRVKEAQMFIHSYNLTSSCTQCIQFLFLCSP